jgi:hypothetical protein
MTKRLAHAADDKSHILRKIVSCDSLKIYLGIPSLNAPLKSNVSHFPDRAMSNSGRAHHGIFTFLHMSGECFLMFYLIHFEKMNRYLSMSHCN